ncbi:MAG TPA: Zn-binding domain-containing protein, partial [bacterium]|nr:Zn-binding domain-containing protein [bacterium]
VVKILQENGDLVPRLGRWYWAKRSYPANEVEVRSASGNSFRIVDGMSGRLVGTVDSSRAFEQVHPGAIYLHQGESYLVQRLDLEQRIASVGATDADYYTQPRTTTDLEILERIKQRPWGSTTAYFGQVEVTTQVIAYARKRLFSDEVLSEEPLDLPEERLQTTALWFPIPPALDDDVRRQGLDLAGGIHAAEHAAIGILPLFAMCDRWDLGGVSYPMYPELGSAAIFIYEGHPGGVGITEKGFGLLDELMSATLAAIEACPCEAGCPSCIQSPKCGNMNEPLDKAAAILLLRGLLGQDGRRRSPGAKKQARSRKHSPTHNARS